MRLPLLLSTLVICTWANNSWKITNVDRTLDISTQIVKSSALVTFENTGASDAKEVLVTISEKEDQSLAYIAARVDGTKGKLKVTKGGISNGFQEYKVALTKAVAKGAQLKLKIDYSVTGSLVPFPAKITQQESQFVQYQGSSFYSAAYPITTEKTTVKLASGKTVSATTVSPSKQLTEKVEYGPYTNQPAFNWRDVKIHYENNSPMVVATLVERTIEISHWGGNIAVEEYIELVHKGAELKGSFSRIDYQMDRRGRRQPALQHFTTILPASAKDIYYRDEIGNISTSAVRLRSDSVEVEIKPRFPLFGGWRTSYVIGYNIPSFEYLYQKGNDFALKMRVLDHIFDNIVVEKLSTKIILPETAQKVKLSTPFSMERRPDETRATYLDTTGRIVVVLQKDNLVPEHIQTFTLSYEFDSMMMLREPFFATVFFFILFTAVIIYVRLDFTIVSDPKIEAKERVRGKVSILGSLVEKKMKLFASFIDEVANFKTTRTVQVLEDARGALEVGLEECNKKISSVITSFKSDCAEAFDKAQELVRFDKSVLEAADNYVAAVQNSKQKNSTEDRVFSQKVADSQSRAESVLASL